eukprot:TRINITY_DN22153_c0_g1_i1.p1 TRINITY_DN22153_c0_g1~~TRINITY_DN22153_c0_g1_i1.p1  ORF type:complete len:941 (+),score=221.22 TRINITY_DN22153_c0_g1_i1:99-2825(+)
MAATGEEVAALRAALAEMQVRHDRELQERQAAEVELRHECAQLRMDLQTLRDTVYKQGVSMKLMTEFQEIKLSRTHQQGAESGTVREVNGRPWRAASPGGDAAGESSPRRLRVRDGSPLKVRLTGRTRSQSPLVTSPGGTGPVIGHGGLSPDLHYLRSSPLRGMSGWRRPPPQRSGSAPRSAPRLAPTAGRPLPQHVTPPQLPGSGRGEADGAETPDGSLPDGRMLLTAVAGCAVDGYGQLICYADGGSLVIYSAGKVGVVHEVSSSRQSFLLGHTAPLVDLAGHPVDQRLVLTAQRSNSDGEGAHGPAICIWDARRLERRWALTARSGVQCAAFSPDGARVAAVTDGPAPTLVAYDWTTDSLLYEAAAEAAVVYGVAWSPYDPSELLTFGLQHATLWSLAPTGSATGRRLQLEQPPQDPPRRVTCATWLRSGVAVGGTDTGTLLFWQQGDLARTVRDTHPGGVSALCALPGASQRGCALALVSAGRDGVLNLWRRESLASLAQAPGSPQAPEADARVDVAERLRREWQRDADARALRSSGPRGGPAGYAGGSNRSAAFAACVTALGQLTGGAAPVRAMALRAAPGGGSAQELRVALLLFSNQVAELCLGHNQQAGLLMQGHSALPMDGLGFHDETAGDIQYTSIVSGMAVHPAQPLAVTVGSDRMLRLWRTSGVPNQPVLQQLCCVWLSSPGSCVDISTHDGGQLVAVGTRASEDGTEQGRATVYSLTARSAALSPCAVCDLQGANALCVSFGPAGRLLAVAHERQPHVGLYRLPKLPQQRAAEVQQCALVATVTAAPSPVCGLRWSDGDDFLETTDDSSIDRCVWITDSGAPAGAAAAAAVRWAPAPARDLDGALGECGVRGDAGAWRSAHSSYVACAAYCRTAPRLLLTGGGGDGCLLAWRVVHE